jgi:hypothetical protein
MRRPRYYQARLVPSLSLFFSLSFCIHPSMRCFLLFICICDTVSSMRGTWIALRKPSDARWLLREGDLLVQVKGGPSQWAISAAGNNNGGRDVLIAAQMNYEG